MNTEEFKNRRRRECRIPCSVPVTLNQASNGQETLYGQLENISQNGALVSLDREIPTEAPVSIAYHVQYQPEAVTNFGHVRWSACQSGKHQIGIEMTDINNIRLPLEQINNYISHIDKVYNHQHDTYQTCLSESSSYDFAFEIYWGMFFWTFKEMLHYQLSNLAHDLNIGLFYIEELKNDFENNKEDTIQSLRCKDILNKGETVISKVKNLCSIFKIMQEEYAKRNQDPLPQIINLDTFLSDRINSFKCKLDTLLKVDDNVFNYQSKYPIELIGNGASLSKGIDFLLLFSYQFVIFQNAKSIQINMSTNDEGICIDFINDGSQALYQKFIEINNEQSDNLDCHPKDKIYLAWINLAMKFFSSYNAKLLLINESGKNIMSLRLPDELIPEITH